MRFSRPLRRAIWTALAAVALFQPVSALAQAGSASGLSISVVDGRLSMDVSDASLSRVLRTIAAKGGFALDIAGQLDSKVSASFENIPLERGLRRIVGRSSYIIELAPPAGAGAARRIAKLSVFARGAPERVKTSSTPRTKRGKAAKRGGKANQPNSRRPPRSPSS